uniref:C2H2-type domain-containing protein n=1 Tax=Leersia perrieri TaxID=77586 RepID=A0A0D9XSZ1_9ORYZ
MADVFGELPVEAVAEAEAEAEAPINRNWLDCDPRFAVEADAAVRALEERDPYAYKLAEELVSNYPFSPLAYTILAEWYRVHGHPKEAKRYLGYVSKLARRCPRTAFHLAAVLWSMGLRHAEVNVCDHRLARREPTDPVLHYPARRSSVLTIVRIERPERRIAYTREGIRVLRLRAEIEGKGTVDQSALFAPEWPLESADLAAGRDLWSSMSEEEREAFLKVNFEDMKSYCRSGVLPQKYVDRMIRVLSGAEEFVKGCDSFSYWVCPLCPAQICYDDKMFMGHIKESHIAEDYMELGSSIPERITDSERELLESWGWEPMRMDGDDFEERADILMNIKGIVFELIAIEAVSLNLLYVMYQFIMRWVRPVTPWAVSMCGSCGIGQLSSAHLKELHTLLEKLPHTLADYKQESQQDSLVETQQDSLVETTWSKETNTLSFGYVKTTSRKTDGSNQPDETFDSLFGKSLLEDPLVSWAGMWQKCMDDGPGIIDKMNEALNKLKLKCSSCEELKQRHGDDFFLPDAILENDIDVNPYFDSGIGSVQVEMLLINAELKDRKNRLLETCKMDYLTAILPIAKACLWAKLNSNTPEKSLPVCPPKGLERQSPLDVVLWSLWHIRHFHDALQKIPRKCPDVTVGQSQIGKELREIFDSWGHERDCKPCDPIGLTRYESLTRCLISEKDGLRTATGIVKSIFRSLHLSQTPLHFEFKGETLEQQTVTEPSLLGCICLMHDLFGLHKCEIKCRCANGIITEYKHTTFLHNVDLGVIGETKLESFNELLKAADKQLLCDTSNGGCGHKFSQYSLLYPPRVLMAVFKWGVDDVSHINKHGVLMSLAEKLDISHNYGGLHSGCMYTLVSAVCRNDQEQYLCFARNENRWLIYDNNTVMYAASWEASIERYSEANLYPEIPKPSNRDWSDCDPRFAAKADKAIHALQGSDPVRLAKELVKKNSDSPLAFTILAEGYLRKVGPRLHKARWHLVTAGKLAPGCPYIFFKLASVLMRLGFCHDVVKVCDRSLSEPEPTDPALHCPCPKTHIDAIIGSKSGECRIAIMREKIRQMRVSLSLRAKLGMKPAIEVNWPQEIVDVDRARRCWSSMSEEERKAFLEVSFGDMKLYCRSRGLPEQMMRVLSDAEEFIKGCGSPLYWICSLCSVIIFDDAKEFMSHMENVHMRDEEYKNLRPSVPERIPDSEIELLKLWKWEPKPINGDDSEKRTEYLSKLEKIVSQLIDMGAISRCLLFIMHKFIMRRVRRVTPLVVSMCGCCGIRQLSSAHLMELYGLLEPLTRIDMGYEIHKRHNDENKSQQDSLVLILCSKETCTLCFDCAKDASRKTDGSSQADELFDSLLCKPLVGDPFQSWVGMGQKCSDHAPDILKKISETLNKLKSACSSCEKLKQIEGGVYFLPDAIFKKHIDIKPYFDSETGYKQVEMLLIDAEMDYWKKKLLETSKVDYLAVILPIATACLQAKLKDNPPGNALPVCPPNGHELKGPLDVILRDGKMTASRMVELILQRLHMSQTPLHFELKGESFGSQRVTQPRLLGCICLAHDLFGLHFSENKCACVNGVPSETKCTTFFHSVDLGAVEKTELKSFSELLKAGDEQLLCDAKNGSCGHKRWKDNVGRHINMHEVLASLPAKLDISHIYEGLHPGSNYTLVSAVCCSDQGQYLCFARSKNGWLIYDNNTIMDAESWEALIERYSQANLCPEILFFEHDKDKFAEAADTAIILLNQGDLLNAFGLAARLVHDYNTSPLAHSIQAGVMIALAGIEAQKGNHPAAVGNLQMATAHLRSAQGARPVLPPHRLQPLLLFRVGSLDEAVEECDRGLRREPSPTHPARHFLLPIRRVYEMLGSKTPQHWIAVEREAIRVLSHWVKKSRETAALPPDSALFGPNWPPQGAEIDHARRRWSGMMSEEERQAFLTVSSEDIKSHCWCLVWLPHKCVRRMVRVLSGAEEFVHSCESSSYLACPLCRIYICVDAEEFVGHIKKSHIGGEYKELRPLMPERITDSERERLRSWRWEPMPIDGDDLEERARILSEVKTIVFWLIDNEAFSRNLLHIMYKFIMRRVRPVTPLEVSMCGCCGMRQLSSVHLKDLHTLLESLPHTRTDYKQERQQDSLVVPTWSKETGNSSFRYGKIDPFVSWASMWQKCMDDGPGIINKINEAVNKLKLKCGSSEELKQRHGDDYFLADNILENDIDTICYFTSGIGSVQVEMLLIDAEVDYWNNRLLETCKAKLNKKPPEKSVPVCPPEVFELQAHLDVILRSLWHIRQLHDALQNIPRKYPDVTAGQSQIGKELREIFDSWDHDKECEPCDPIGSMRFKGLTNCLIDKKKRIRPASEVVKSILRMLHSSLTPLHFEFKGQTFEVQKVTNPSLLGCICLAHDLFGLHNYENIWNCVDEVHTKFGHMIDLGDVRKTELESFSELVVPMESGNGSNGHLLYPPHLYMTVFEWGNDEVSHINMHGVLLSLAEKLDISHIYGGLHSGCMYTLVSAVCRNNQGQNLWFAREKNRWIIYDGKTVEAIPDKLSYLSFVSHSVQNYSMSSFICVCPCSLLNHGKNKSSGTIMPTTSVLKSSSLSMTQMTPPRLPLRWLLDPSLHRKVLTFDVVVD